MKLLHFYMLALSLLSFVIATPTALSSDRSPSLYARFDSAEEGRRENTEPETAVKQPKVKTEPIPSPGTRISVQSIKAAIRNLPRQPWVKSLVKIVDALKRLVGIRPSYHGSRSDLFETNEFGDPFLTIDELDLSDKQIKGFKEVAHSGGRMFSVIIAQETIQMDFDTGKRGMIEYRKIYVSPYWAVSTLLDAKLLRAHAVLRAQAEADGLRKRSSTLEVVSGQPGSPGAGIVQDSTAVYQQYYQSLLTVQSSIGALIAPVLNNITSGSNSTLIHQMALSIYYDLTGSTTLLVGPFNNGMSYLDKNVTSLPSQGTHNATSNTTAQFFSVIENIYGSLYVKAFTAANSTGLYAEQLYLAECLYTSDTSMYPAGFNTTVQQ